MKKIILILISSLCILMVTLIYTNSTYTFSVEDSFFSKIYLWKNKVFNVQPKKVKQFVFINTGKDISLVDDASDYGLIAITDRAKLVQFFSLLNSIPQKPLYTFVDLDFDLITNNNPKIDTTLAEVISQNKNSCIAKQSTNLISSLSHFQQVNVSYTTFGNGFTKFKLFTNDSLLTVPVFLHKKLDNIIYHNSLLYYSANSKICLSSIWPTYYITFDNLIANKYSYAAYYNLGELLLLLQNDKNAMVDYVTNKIIVIGNFNKDVHTTIIGNQPGTLLLMNVYLSILNKEAELPYVWLITLFICFCLLSYIAIYSEMPQIILPWQFIFSEKINKNIQTYISYFGCLFFISLVSVYIWNIHVSLWVPSFLFTGISRLKNKWR